MDFALPPELETLRDSLARYVKEELLPLEAKHRVHELEGDIPQDLRRAVRRRARDLGFYGIHMPEEVGGGGLSILGVVVLKEEISRLGPEMGAEVMGGFGGPTPILMACNAGQRERYLAPVMRAEKTLSFALTEPGAGSDAASITTRAVADGDHWVINGRKHFISNGPWADFVVVFAVTDPEKRARGGITAFLVDRGTPGFVVGKIQRTMADAVNQCELLFEGCRVPAGNVLGRVGWGFETAMRWISQGRLSIAASCVGTAERLLAMSADYARERVQFGRPIGENQAIQWMLADMAVEARAGRWMVYRAAWKADRKEDVRREASMAKLFCSELAGRAADAALQIHGGMGYMREFPIEGVYRKVRAARIGEGTSEIQRLQIARSLLGEAGG